LAKNAGERYATADDALAELDALRDARDAALASGELGLVTVDHGDATTPLPTFSNFDLTPQQSAFGRPVSPLMCWGVSVLLAAALLTSILLMRADIARQQPTGVITDAQRAQAIAKDRALATLRMMTTTGRYEEAIRGYDEYIARYPHSTVARTERDEAQRLHDAAMASIKSDAEITRVARKIRREKAAQVPPPEPPKKPSRWERIKRWYRGE
jgi:hypothetical protein